MEHYRLLTMVTRAAGRLAVDLARVTVATGAIALAAIPVSGATRPALPPAERSILLGVGQEYELTPVEVKLLLAIRRVENGRTGLEMGVGSNNPGHRARRHANHPERSLRLQAQWAAGTIKKRFKGDVDAFARIYCPPNSQRWAYLVRYWMDRVQDADQS